MLNLGVSGFYELTLTYRDWAQGVATMSDSTFLHLSRDLRSKGVSHAKPLIAKCMALVAEVSDRALGLRPHPNQIQAAYAMLRGTVAELATGEGKTLAAVMTAACAVAAGRQVHVITANDYLAERDAREMAPLYQALGITVSWVTETMPDEERKSAWRNSVVYASNKMVAFDHLRDRVANPQGFSDLSSKLDAVLRKFSGGEVNKGKTFLCGLDFCIVDEADSVLIDEANTPLILSSEDQSTSGKSRAREKLLRELFELSGIFEENHDFEVLPGVSRRIRLSEVGRNRLRQPLAQEQYLPLHRLEREELTVQALTALHLLKRDEAYVVIDGICQIVDPETGRTMPDRRWNRGLQQMVEIKESVKLSAERETIAQISYQRLFQRYLTLCGMTGTAEEVRGELGDTYGLIVRKIPTHHPLRRDVMPVRWFGNLFDKESAIVQKVIELSRKGAPVMVACSSVAESERISEQLSSFGVESSVLNARQSAQEAEIISRAGQAGCITIATGMAGRGTDIKLSGLARQAGGLQVLLASPHESARVDRQFAGRCARQGDPGVVWRYGSAEDSFFQRYDAFRHLSPGLRLYLTRLWVARASRRARAMLMRYDSQLGQALAFSGGDR